ncbi:type II toxin-antitoxin system RelE/ParE family toxin [Salmonella enterica subsp. enterica]|nr:type II toxin-antitoxin system RelE/ParE family toxin [Salmonella enterica subsp. enterica serovar Paratyphi A]
MSHRIRFTPKALSHLDEIEIYIEAAASPGVAARYVDAIVDFCERLADFPQRGAARDDVRPGLRLVGFRHRVTIAFAVTPEAVNILGVYYGGRDFEPDLEVEE